MEPKEFSLRVKKEIQNFTKVLEDGGVTSSIAPIFTYWASKFLSPRLVEVFGQANIPTIFSREIMESYDRVRNTRSLTEFPFRVISLGSGDCLTEIEVVKELVASGCSIEFVCTDLNPTVSEFASACAVREGVAQHMKFNVIDLNQRFPE